MSSSRKKYFTVLIVPHSEDHSISIRLPLFALQAAGVIMALLFIAAFIFVRGYVQSLDSAEKISILKEENRVQKEQIDLLARETESLLLQVQRMHLLQEEIKSLVAEDELAPGSYQQTAEADGENLAEILSSPRLSGSSRGDNLVVNRMASNISTLQDSLPDKVYELVELKESVEDHQKKLAHTPSIRPAQGRISSPFGPRVSPISRRREVHTGIDIANSTGTSIYATANGRVVTAEYRRGWGNLVIVDHGYGYRTKYAHLASFSVEVGSTVEKGQIIGRMGSTGYSTGPHLHYEVHVNGIPVDPKDFIE